ncbi:MAG: sigma-70 family RNA polymerase sigma factor [Spirochaetales bacterium]|nr:sigma-70 family RNA polymerase sigma factor [Spirochaetales bacterium]
MKNNNTSLYRELEKKDKTMKRLAARFNMNKSPAVKRQLISALSPLTVHYPQYFKIFNKDFQHDFYIFILSKFDKLFALYTPKDDCKFITWFSLILNRNLKLFIRLRKKKNALNLREEIIDEKKEKEYFVAENNIKYENDNENEDEKYYDFINTILKSPLSPKEKKIIILKFSNFCFTDSEDPILLRKFHILELLKERIHKNQLNIIRLERLLFKCNNPELCEKITKRINKIKQARKSKLELLENFNMCRSNKWLAKEMNIKNSTVSSLLMRAKKKLATQKIEIVLFPTVDNEDNKI